MTWWGSYLQLEARGVLGMNRRNTECILDHNPRRYFPIVDSKRTMAELCTRLDVATPKLYAGLASHSTLRHLPRLLAKHRDFVIKPNRGAAGRGILVVTDTEGGWYVRHNAERLSLG